MFIMMPKLQPAQRVDTVHKIPVQNVLTAHTTLQQKLPHWDILMFLRDISLRLAPKRVAPTLLFATDAVLYIIRAKPLLL